MRVTVIATGFLAENSDNNNTRAAAPAIPTVTAPAAQPVKEAAPAPAPEAVFNVAEPIIPETKVEEPVRTSKSYEDIYGEITFIKSKRRS